MVFSPYCSVAVYLELVAFIAIPWSIIMSFLLLELFQDTGNTQYNGV